MNLTNLDLQERVNLAVVCTNTKHWDKHSELSEQRKPNEGVADCPNCGSYLPKTGASFCMHCRNELVWFDGLVKAVGQLPRAEIMNQVGPAEQERSKFLFTSPLFWFGLILLTPHGSNPPSIGTGFCPNFSSGEGYYECSFSGADSQGETTVDWSSNTGHSSTSTVLSGNCSSGQVVTVDLDVDNPYGTSSRAYSFNCPTGPIP